MSELCKYITLTLRDRVYSQSLITPRRCVTKRKRIDIRSYSIDNQNRTKTHPFMGEVYGKKTRGRSMRLLYDSANCQRNLLTIAMRCRRMKECREMFCTLTSSLNHELNIHLDWTFEWKVKQRHLHSFYIVQRSRQRKYYFAFFLSECPYHRTTKIDYWSCSRHIRITRLCGTNKFSV